MKWKDKSDICFTLWMHSASLAMDGINWHLQVRSRRKEDTV
jgi:hypothetical protein